MRFLTKFAIALIGWNFLPPAEGPAATIPPPKGYTIASAATTSLLAHQCSTSREELSADFCSGYVLGTFDSLSAAQRICPTDKATTEQVMAVARLYLSGHPELWEKAPSWVLEQAFKAAYPCR
jgi:hypothetical protein